MPYRYSSVRLKEAGSVAVIYLNRPNKANAFDHAMFKELQEAVLAVDASKTARVVVLMGEGKHFCGGIEVDLLEGMLGEVQQSGPCPAVARQQLHEGIRAMQEAYTALERCRWPVIAAVHGACVGAGVDLITACDLRYCCEEATFVVKEVDLAITADLGTLQRLPTIIGHGPAMHLALTAQPLTGQQALSLGLVSACYPSREMMVQEVMATAGALAQKPPLALQGTKRILLHKRDHSVEEGLKEVALYNSAFLISEELDRALKRVQARKTPHTRAKL